VVDGSRFTGAGFFLERVLGTVLRDDRGASSHQLVSRVVLVRTPWVSGFFFGFYLRDLLSILMESALADAGVVFICYSGLYFHVFIFIIVLFIRCDLFIYFI
jgi:hypothetical protein